MNHIDGNIVVTGADGMIGANTLRGLKGVGFSNVVAVDNVPREADTRYVRTLPHTSYMSSAEFLEQIRGDTALPITAIIHLGAISATTATDRELVMRTNVDYSKELFAYCARHGCRFIYASSAATYGDGGMGYRDTETNLHPLNLYGESKHRFDLFARSAVRPPSAWVGLKPFNVYGPYESHKGRMASMVYHGYREACEKGTISLFRSHHINYENGGYERDFIYVGDVVKVILFFLGHREIRGIFNVGTGRARSFNDLARAVFAALGMSPDIRYVPMPRDLKGRYQYHTQANISSLRAAGYTDDFLSLEDGVARYVQWLKNPRLNLG